MSAHSSIRIIEGVLHLSSAKVAIIVARFNGFVVEALLDGALDALRRAGLADEDITVVRVPGAFEIPPVAKRLADSGQFEGIIALGAVIRGSTAHFDYVAGECAKGIAQVQNTTTVPVSFGVITTDTIEQAIERCGTKAGNKGAESALGLVEMINVMRQLPDAP